MKQIPLGKMPFFFSVVELRLKALSPIFFDKYPGFIIRSGFGAALKKLCIYQSRRTPCTACRLRDSCPYSYIFETYRGEREIDFTAENFPHPFVFYPSVKEEGLVCSGSEFTLTLTLFGKGIDYLLFYVYAFDLLGDMGLGKSRGRYALDSVVDHFSGETLYSHADKTLRGEPIRKSLGDLVHDESCNSIQIEFTFPTKIEEQSRTINHLTPNILIRGLLRRASLLSDRHCEQKWHINFKEIIEDFQTKVSSFSSKLAPDCLERYSARQQRPQKHFVFTGSFSINGDIAPYLPLIQLGSYMHIGKSTSQGFGKYELVKSISPIVEKSYRLKKP